MTIWRETARGIRLRLRVQPRSSHDRVVGVYGDALKVQVNAAPVGGGANQAVVEVVAAWLGVPRAEVALIQGHASRDKLVEITTDSPGELTARLRAALAIFIDKQQAGD